MSVFYFSPLNSVRAQGLYNGENAENNGQNPSVLFPKVHGYWQMSSQGLFLKDLSCVRSWEVLGRAGQGSVQQSVLSDRIGQGLVTGKCDAACSPGWRPKIMHLPRAHKDLLPFSQLWIFLNFFLKQIPFSTYLYSPENELCLLLHKAATHIVCPKLIVFQARVLCPGPWVLPAPGLICPNRGVLSSFMNMWEYLVYTHILLRSCLHTQRKNLKYTVNAYRFYLPHF